MFSVVTMTCSGDQFEDLPNAGNGPFGNGGRCSAVSFALLIVFWFCFQSDVGFAIFNDFALQCSVMLKEAALNVS